MRSMGHRLLAHKGQPYPFIKGQCLDRGRPCCVFGQILLDASPAGSMGGREIFPELRDQSATTNAFALARALGFEGDDCLANLPQSLIDAVGSISDANDNERYTERQRRAEVADRIFYAADVLAYADIPGCQQGA
jgi:hypothetical protein